MDLAELTKKVAANSRAAFPERHIEVDTPTGLDVFGAPDQLLRVLTNLVANAAVHTRLDGPINISCHPVAEGIVISVADHGPGLPPEDASRVFDRFWRADRSRSRVPGGSGLGLSIVAAIVQVHGGSVSFDSAVDIGTTVTVVLPVCYRSR